MFIGFFKIELEIFSVRIVHVKQELELDVWNETMHYTSILSRGNMIVCDCMTLV